MDERISQAIETCGLWVCANRNPHRSAFKDAGYRWAPQQERWYFAGVPAGGFRSMVMDEIRQRVIQKSEYAPARTEEQAAR